MKTYLFPVCGEKGVFTSDVERGLIREDLDGLFQRLAFLSDESTTHEAGLFLAGRRVPLDDAGEVGACREGAEGLAPVAGEAGGAEGIGHRLVAVADEE